MYKTAAMTCLALFMTAVLEKFFHGKPDYRTLRLLDAGNESGSTILKTQQIDRIYKQSIPINKGEVRMNFTLKK